MLPFEILLPALIACLVLVPLLSYLGMHVLARGVIFIDIALTQLAALGAALASLFGVEPHTPMSYVWSFVFAVLGSGIIASMRRLSARVPHEAFIGITYAVAAAATILVASALPHGDEEIRHALVGDLLTVGFGELAIVTAIAVVVGLAHYLLRRRFIALSFAGERFAHAALWEFGLYVSFGVAITAAVQIAGVLLVFSFLIVPAVFAALFARRLSARLAVAWIMGPVASIAGLWASYRLDLPTGATIVVALGAALGLGIAVRAMVPSLRASVASNANAAVGVETPAEVGFKAPLEDRA